MQDVLVVQSAAVRQNCPAWPRVHTPKPFDRGRHLPPTQCPLVVHSEEGSPSWQNETSLGVGTQMRDQQSRESTHRSWTSPDEQDPGAAADSFTHLPFS